jgi:CHAT domain-containing protein/Tfp pilus assembly protein PilF
LKARAITEDHDQSRRSWFSRFREWLPILVILSVLPLRDSSAASPQSAYDHAWLLFVRGDLENSQLEAQREYARFRFSDRLWASRLRLVAAEAMVARGTNDDALQLLAAYQPIPEDRGEEVQDLAIEAVALTRQQQTSLADQKLNQAELICRGSAYSSCGEVLRARGILAGEQGKLAEARQYYVDTLAFANSHRDKFLAATAVLNLGWTAMQVDHFDEAMDWLRSARPMCAELGAEALAERASGNLGWAYLNLGDGERALELFVDATRSAAQRGDNRSELGWITTAGYVYRRNGDIERAAQSYRRSLKLATDINSKRDIANALEDLANVSIDAGRLEEAQDYLQQLGALLGSNGNRVDALDVAFAQARISVANHKYNDAESLFREVEKDPASQTSMRFGAEHELARLYESEERTSDADRMYQTSLSTFESARADLKNEESKLPFLANATSIYDDYIHFLVAHHKTDEALALADRSRARTLEQGLGVIPSSRAISNATLRPGEVARRSNATLLFYWLGERESYLWAITPAKTSMFTLPPRNQITPLVERYRKTLLGLSDPAETFNTDGIALYRMLVAPAREMIRPGSTVMILNDGALSLLNFETLIAPEPAPHYFIEDATLVSASSLDLLASAKPPGRTGNKLLLFGDAVSPNPDYPDLPKAATEMKQIEQHFSAPEVTVFARERATAGSYLTSAPQQFAYIHFVAHGVASRTDPLDSAIILSRSTAEADSFKLHARDIMKHPIRARLVTISACYGSGIRSYAGEGLVGLAWSFLRAGAHNVIGALWEVSEESAPRLMGSLYEGLEAGQPPAEALRKAKLALLHSKGEFRKPFFWAPLQIYTGV